MDSFTDYTNTTAATMYSTTTHLTNQMNGMHIQGSGATQLGLATTTLPANTLPQGPGGFNNHLKNVIGTPSMSSSTSSGYGSQAVSLGNLTSDDTLSLRSMSVDETPDLDRSSSASPPMKVTAANTGLATPSGASQKRFNPFMKDTNNAVDLPASTLMKTPIATTPTKKHPLQIAGEVEEDEEGDDDDVNDAGQGDVSGSSDNQQSNVTVDDHHLTHSEMTPNETQQQQQAEEQQREEVVSEVNVEEDFDVTGNNNNSNISNKNEMAMIPEWIVVGESVLIRPYNTSGVISFIGPTHFQVCGSE